MTIFGQYFQRLQEQLTASASLAGLAPHSGEGGKNSELLVASTLRAHLPSRAAIVHGGLLADTTGRVSNQVDVLICNEFAFRGSALPLGVIPVEALIAAVEVKSTQHRDSMKDLFVQNAQIKTLMKRLFATSYDDSRDPTIRTLNPLVAGWFWQARNHTYQTADTAAAWLCDPVGHMNEADFRKSRPNAIYLHQRYVVITDPTPRPALVPGAGKPNPFLESFREHSDVLRGKTYSGTGGTQRDIYYFEDSHGWNSLEVILMWLAHEVNRYALEIPNTAQYVSRPPKQTGQCRRRDAHAG